MTILDGNTNIINPVNKSKNSGNVALFDYLKSFAIILVIFTHYAWTSKEREGLIFPYVISMAVPIFMIVSGYVLSKSCERMRINEIGDMYNIPYLLKRAVRFSLPFAIAFLMEIFFEKIQYGTNYTLKELIKFAWDGGFGPGSYYYPLMMQMILFFPLVFEMMRKRPLKGLVIAFLINLAYEVSVQAYSIRGVSYRLLIFRYVFLIACGVYLYFKRDAALGHGKKFIPISILSLAIGVYYLWFVSYKTDIHHTLFQYWTKTSMMSAFYIFPIIYILYRLLRNVPQTKFGKILALPGKASYHIFLTQMVFYYILDVYLRRHYLKSTGDNKMVIAYIIICVSIGIIYYYIETPLEKYVADVTARGFNTFAAFAMRIRNSKSFKEFLSVIFPHLFKK